MSESEKTIQREMDAKVSSVAHKEPLSAILTIADRLDRLEAVAAEIIRERDEAKVEVERLRAELADAIRDRDQMTRGRDAWHEEARMSVVNRDQARDEVERLRAELAARPEPRGWLTEEERGILQNLLLYQWGSLGWQARIVPALNAIIARAGSPPVVEVPALKFLGPMTGREQGIVLAYRNALDSAGIPWKEKGVPRE